MIRRLYLKALWLKKTYTFSWAHKPLCHNYSKDVIKIGHVYLCRSCTCAYLGILFGLIWPYLLPDIIANNTKVVLVVLISLTFPLSYPALYKRFHRRFRDLLRFSLGLLIALGGRLLLEGSPLVGFATFLLCFILWKMYYSKRAARKIKECEECTEHSEDYICSGYIQQAQCLREYEDEATEYLLSTRYRPDHLK